MNKKNGLCAFIIIICTLFLIQTTSPRHGGGWGWGWGLGWGLGWGNPWWWGGYGYPYYGYGYYGYPYGRYRDRYAEDREDRAYRAGLSRGRREGEERRIQNVPDNNIKYSR